MENINWNKLRTLDGSQHAAFEELCCQLAAYEHMPTGSKFIRVGAPDAGVECYWTLPNEDERAWQAKFFTTPPNETQWGEVDKSVKTALQKHPRLTSYTVCFPLDLQDPRLEDKLWSMDKWNQHVKKWKRWTQEKAMSVEFAYWGKHEMLDRLSHDDHRGRSVFWFSQELFNDHWLQERLQEAINNAGPRYTPELNVDLPIAHLFDGLGRTTTFFERLGAQVKRLRQAYRSISHYHQDSLENEYSSLSQSIQELLALTQFDQENVTLIDWEQLKSLISATHTKASQYAEKIESTIQERERATLDTTHESQQNIRRTFTASDVRQLMRTLRNLEASIQSDEARLANLPALLLAGDAGRGKTHLFCDVAQQRLKQGRPTILLLGQQFGNSEPWSQIKNILALPCERDQFLGALNATGEACRKRALILIDALNEGEGKRLWINFLAGMLTIIARYPWVGIAISVRESYEEVTIPEGLVPRRLVRTIHYGFVEHEYEATKTYFDHYGIERPSIPLLLPEFQNPLFLKLFCQGLQAGNHRRIPEGLQGITATFNFFLDNLNSKLTKLHELDLNPKVPHVRNAVQALSEELAKQKTSWLPHKEAQTIVDRIVSPRSYDNSLFRQLIVEGVLAEDQFLVLGENGKTSSYEEGIRFAYERLSDHLITQYLLDEHLDIEHPQKLFEMGASLEHLVSNEQACWQNRGLIEALSIQLPERISKELCELIPSRADDQVICEAFVESFLWREPSSITDTTFQLAKAHALRYKGTCEQFFNAVLTLATNPRHPYNADFLHDQLIEQSIAHRDAWWSIFLYEQYDEGVVNPVNRLVDWAWKTEDISYISDEALRLAATALCWFLTTSHRFLRDRATKALVKLLGSRFHVLRKLLDTFAEVNDPYVSERLYAVAYGCAMRCTNLEELKALAQDVYDRLFSNGQPPSHILLRDHARGIIERALTLGLDVTVQVEKLRPPYHNTWPEVFPSETEVNQLTGATEESDEELSLQERGRFDLSFSIMHGDFARYVIGTNASSSKWSSHRLIDPVKPSRREGYERFIASLTTRQQHAVERYREAYRREIQYQVLAELRHFFQEQNIDEETQQDNTMPVQVLIQEQESSLEEDKRCLYTALGKHKAVLFEQEVLPWLEQPEEPEEQLDLTLLQHWVVKHVFELGWTMKRFGEFDAMVNRITNKNGGRLPDKPERIGKKYQWIAYYNIMAQAADTFTFRNSYWEDEDCRYEGPWQISPIRNLDPSFLLENTRANRDQIQTSSWWNIPSPRWSAELNDREWLNSENILPDPSLLIEVKYPKDNSVWLTLHSHYIWKQPLQSEEERDGPQGREVWYFLESCLVKRLDAQKIFAWAKRHNFSEDHLPEPHGWHNIYLGELYWSPCYQYYYTPLRDSTEWTRGNEDKLPFPITPTTEMYNWERDYDCSIEETVSCAIPSKYLVEGMQLTWSGIEGHHVTPSGEQAAFDPSIHEAGPSALLVHRDTFLKFLQDNDLGILWTIRGEKNAYGNENWPESFAGQISITGAYMYTEQGLLQGEFHAKGTHK